jgi:hypothetical protein
MLFPCRIRVLDCAGGTKQTRRVGSFSDLRFQPPGRQIVIDSATVPFYQTLNEELKEAAARRQWGLRRSRACERWRRIRNAFPDQTVRRNVVNDSVYSLLETFKNCMRAGDVRLR